MFKPALAALALATLVNGIPRASAASFAVDIYDGSDFTGSIVGQATLSMTSGYPICCSADVRSLEDLDLTLTVNSLDPGFAGVVGLAVDFVSSDDFLFPAVDSADPGNSPPVPSRTFTAPSGWQVTDVTPFETVVDSFPDPDTINRFAVVTDLVTYRADNLGGAIGAGASLSGFSGQAFSAPGLVGFDSTYTRAYAAPSLSEIPEPGQFSLVALGLVALPLLRWKRRNNGRRS